MKISNVLLLFRNRKLTAQIYQFTVFLIFCPKIFTFTNSNINKKIVFLSRFEKQLISYRDPLSKNFEKYIRYAECMLTTHFGTKYLTEVFYGYCDDTMSSALLYLGIQKTMKTKETKDDEEKEQTQATNITLDNVQFDLEELKLQLLDLFFLLCRPEAVTKIRINADTQMYSLETAVKTQQKNAKNQMVMAITNDMEHNIPIEWLHYTKKISSFTKVVQFEKMIKDFFSDKISDGILILQYRYTPKSEDQLEQIIHILQFEHYLFYNATNNNEEKLIVLLIHANTESPFPLIFRQLKKINNFFC
ncbi:hypothetical protein RFI_35688 [Reticulomyxa filosa]|uniref:Uncharacterized protein n=1 Tax=Reticulomyxa filosa TaxID=46433 RepID=X6LIG2_RETFI|nr:hypothetical protein RFI_35688 [Reticulomyxa filosa]|eukprot:ETO01753.1 hypothetical protein RFI_35688 [Reticulomyxa filosa]